MEYPSPPSDAIKINSFFNADFSNLLYSPSKNKFYQLEEDFFGNSFYREKTFALDSREVILEDDRKVKVKISAEKFEHWWLEHMEIVELKARINELENRLVEVERFIQAKWSQ